MFWCRKGVTLKQFLDGFKHEAGLVVHWVLMGSNGRETRPTQGGVLRHYNQCDKDPSVFVKTIANTWFLANHGGNVHNYEYRCVSMHRSTYVVSSTSSSQCCANTP